MTSPTLTQRRTGAAIESALLAALARCDRLLDTAGADAALAALVADLAACRRRAGVEEWRRAVVATRAHPVHARLREDPFIADALAKPRGYPGDAHTIDFVYRHRPLHSGVSELGRALHAVTTRLPVVRAVRGRCAHVADVLGSTVRRRPDAVIVSVACGHLRELHLVHPQLPRAATVVAVDQDPRTLAALPALHPGLRVVPRAASVRSLLLGRDSIPEADLVYASGLYDYLDDSTAAALTRSLAERLRPGGVLLVVNLTPANEEIALMEAVTDWWMVYRSPEDMGRLAAAQGTRPGTDYSIYPLASCRLVCLAVCRADHAAADSACEALQVRLPEAVPA